MTAGPPSAQSGLSLRFFPSPLPAPLPHPLARGSAARNESTHTPPLLPWLVCRRVKRTSLYLSQNCSPNCLCKPARVLKAARDMQASVCSVLTTLCTADAMLDSIKHCEHLGTFAGSDCDVKRGRNLVVYRRI